MDVQTIFAQAEQHRREQRWDSAIALLRSIEGALSGRAVFHHNFAVCLLGSGDAQAARLQAEKALRCEKPLWQSVVLLARVLRETGQLDEAFIALQNGVSKFPQQPELVLELAGLTLHHACDASQARALVKPWLQHPQHGVNAGLTDLMASLYDRGIPPEPAKSLNERLIAFATTHLDLSNNSASGISANSNTNPARTTKALADTIARSGVGGRRLRVGLLSPLFSCSPVYFFTIGALRYVGAEVDLIFFNRGTRSDWATQEFRSLAKDWFDVPHLDPSGLSQLLRKQTLDVLVDLGGWMDPLGLQAVSTRPASRQYKWVGGQSATTGLSCFDGFITDQAQTPASHDRWYTEPLIRLPNGYVTYSAPAYMPEPQIVPQTLTYGVMANPVKLSGQFMADLNTLLSQSVPDQTLALHFIDRRYQVQSIRQRITDALSQAMATRGDRLELHFITPASHLDYLSAIGEVSEMIDTYPYTGGLTTMEALTLGVPIRGHRGQMFCERHTHAHLHYCRISGARAPRNRTKAGQLRYSLIDPAAPRLDHQSLASSLLELFTEGYLAPERQQ